MHKLSRRVRFSINPFPSTRLRAGLSEEIQGANSFASKPAGEGLSIFLELSVELAGNVEPTTGFVVNVTDIDKNVLRFVVPIFAERIRADFQQRKHIRLFAIAELLRSAWGQLADKFGPARLSKLSLKLNPFREVTIDCEDFKMIYFSEKFEFAATHKLWNDEFSQQHNFKVFGKCANPNGHGHNYVVEVTIKKSLDPARDGPIGKNDFCIGDFEKTVDDELIKLIDHKNLNVDIAEFGRTNPTVENIAAFAWKKLTDKFIDASLYCVRIWETDRTCCSYYG